MPWSAFPVRLCGTRPPDSAGNVLGEDSDPVLVPKPRGQSMSHQMRAKLPIKRRTLHGAKDEDEAPWTNLFTMHGLAPNHPVGRRTRKAGAPFLCLKSRTAPVPEGTGSPQIFFYQSLKRADSASRRVRAPRQNGLSLRHEGKDSLATEGGLSGRIYTEHIEINFFHSTRQAAASF